MAIDENKMIQYFKNLFKADEGLTLIEVLVVLAILGVLAAVAAPNAGKFIGYAESTISEEVNCVIYISESGVQKQIGKMNLGKISIVHPKQMSIDDSAEILLRLFPSQDIADNATLTYGSTGIPRLYYEVTDTVRLYPVMFAELKAANFRISNDANYYRALSMESVNDWNWLISPLNPGTQIISIQLLTPVQVHGYEQQVAQAVYNRSFKILVNKPINWVPFVTGLGAFGAFLGGLAAILKVRQRRRLKKEKQTNNKKQ